MNDAEAWGARRRKLKLMVRHPNSEALEFYERLGHEDGNVTVLGVG